MDDEYKVKARIVLEVVGKPKEHVSKSLKDYVTKIEEGYKVEDKTVKRPKKVQGELFSTFAELTIWFKDYSGVINFCIDWMPASVEIEEPSKLHFSAQFGSDVANDILAKLHNVDMALKTTNQKNTILSQSLGVIIQNAVLILLNMGPRTPEQMSKVVGVDEKQLGYFLKRLVEAQKIKEKEGRYELIVKKS